MERFQVKLNSKVISRHITVLKAQPQPNQMNEAVLYALKPINVTNKVRVPDSRRIFKYGSNKVDVEDVQSSDRKHITTGPNNKIECCISLFRNVIDMLMIT
ncbi:hypothetical protein J6590_039769 [Homalodisca vitripennis]|nr:hypothetical protein J6590_039769 [Homalodisca vitripennis]